MRPPLLGTPGECGAGDRGARCRCRCRACVRVLVNQDLESRHDADLAIIEVTGAAFHLCKDQRVKLNPRQFGWSMRSLKPRPTAAKSTHTDRGPGRRCERCVASEHQQWPARYGATLRSTGLEELWSRLSWRGARGTQLAAAAIRFVE
jgi:hypothetical protein